MSATFPNAAPSFRGRIGGDARSGYYPVPHRYRLHVAPSCPDGLRIAVTHSLLGLGATLPVTPLPALPDAPDGGYTALRPLYEASAHRHPGPAAPPVLSDAWTGRVVSTHAGEILGDLVRHFGGPGSRDVPPAGREAVTRAVGRLCDQGVSDAAQRAGRSDADDAARSAALEGLLLTLGMFERRLSGSPCLLGEEPTPADVHLWVALVQLDTVHRWHLDAAAVHRVTGHPRLWAYARRLASHPAFAPHLDLEGIVLRHHAHCRGREAAGAAVRIVDWRPTGPVDRAPAVTVSEPLAERIGRAGGSEGASGGPAASGRGEVRGGRGQELPGPRSLHATASDQL
ncbi:glutathione S-transferase C-terminal domain-containing protein [Streptomyces sp. NPDC007904]|jgi:putative glutathione S-transferase|uniref:glutathione S-transferase C-terminal domain-containing protein n=1 Tax=Streptomyces sp. NPDC007904 TaxID=3364787 RepID=UPI0036E07E3D